MRCDQSKLLNLTLLGSAILIGGAVILPILGEGNTTPATPAIRYRVTLLDRDFWPVAINDKGEILVRRLSSIDDAGHILAWEGGKWKETLVDIEPSGMNNSGQVVGERGMAQYLRPGSIQPALLHAYIWKNGQARDLGTLGGSQSIGNAINDRGHVVGWADLPGRVRSHHAFLWSAGRMRDLGTLSGYVGSNAVSINEKDAIIGIVGPPDGSSRSRDIIWENGQTADLGVVLGVGTSGVSKVNNRGQIVGNAHVSGKSSKHCFVWDKGAAQDLGSIGSKESDCSAKDINDHGQIVGDIFTTTEGEPETGLGFIWKDGKMIDLNQLADLKDGWRIAEAIAINNRGQIIAGGYLSGCCDLSAHRYGLLTPIEKRQRGERCSSTRRDGLIMTFACSRSLRRS